jgi:hypothetical protein
LCEALPAPYGFERGRIPLKDLRTYEEEMGGEKKEIGLGGTRKKLSLSSRAVFFKIRDRYCAEDKNSNSRR